MAGARVSTDADGLERQAVRREEDQLVHEEIARLPAVYRAAVVLCDLEGQSHEEAARRLGCSDRTLRRRLRRARDMLRARLMRRGLAPTATAGMFTAAFGPARASAAISQITVDAVARAATRFAAGQAAASIVSTLAEGVITAMLWTKLRGIAMASSVFLAIGIGTGVTLAFVAPADDKKVESKSGAREVLKRNEPTPAEQYRLLVKGYDDAMAALSKLVERAKTEAERQTIYMDYGLPEKDFNPRFLALAERYPDDPVAADALVWIVEKAMRYSIGGHNQLMAETMGRTMEVFARDHRGDARLGPLCLKLVNYPSPRRDVFLRAVAERSPDRVVRGRAIVALAQYLKMKGEFAGSLKKSPKDGGYDETLVRDMYGPEYLKQLRTLEEAFNFAVKAANRAAEEAQKKAGKAEPGGENVRAYISAYPKWGDYGPKMWQLAQDSPRHQAAFDALIWLVEQGPRFFDAKAERDTLMSQVVDALIRDHLESIAAHLTDRNVAMALNMGEQLQMPYRERLLQALHERSRDRLTRGRMGLALGRYLKAEADFVERLTRPWAEKQPRLDVVFLEPAYVERLRKADRGAIEHRAEGVLERVIADYGEVVYVNGTGATQETLAVVAKRELAEIRTVSVGRPAPEIAGEDVDGRPMKLSEFRGKVILLDFGSHEHCGGCAAVYARLRSTLDRLRGRPFAVLGINNNDRRDALKQAIVRGEITWRCWWDGDKRDGPGPITSRWNVRGYPTFFLIDHKGVIRSKADLHPFDTPSFDNAIDALLKEAEAARP